MSASVMPADTAEQTIPFVKLTIDWTDPQGVVHPAGTMYQAASWQEYYELRAQPYIQALGELESPEMGDLDYDTFEALMEQLQHPEEWGDEAERAEAKRMGFLRPDGSADVEALRGWKSLNQQFVTKGTGFAGLPEETKAALRKQQAMAEQTAREQARKMAEVALANSGMTGKMMEAYDEANRSIADSRVRFEVQLANQDFAAQLERYRAYDEMFQRGQIAYKDYLDLKERAVSDALQAWSQEAATIMEQYRTEWEGVMHQAELIQAQAALELGVMQESLDYASDVFQQWVNEHLGPMEITQAEQLIKQMEIALDHADLNTLKDWIIAIGELLYAIITGGRG